MVLIGMLTLFFCWQTATFASDQTTPKNENEVKKTEAFPRWWTRNPFSYDEMPDKLLWHLETTYQWNRSTGNWTSDNHNLNTLFSLRYDRYTNHVRYQFDKRNVAKPQDPPDSDEDKLLRKSTMHEFHEDFRIALNKTYYLAPGVIYFEDDYEYIDARYTYYLGAGAQFIPHPIARLSLFGAYGYETLSYIDDYHEVFLLANEWKYDENFLDENGINTSLTPSILENYDPGTDEYSVAFLKETIRLFPHQNVMVTQEGVYVLNLDDSDRYRWEFKLGVDFKVMEHLFVALELTEKYNNDANQLIGVRKHDQTRSIGLKIVF